ncbi:OLC1v1015587C3 [Oldenlandia corymbosa var. corymbosa]|uniref:mannan endo-1,4-beta-mannosidase n=1 Tax=Oldenlandia corymbosa var. corymbosa TaxID=529605 RepID=A0AAV1E3N3_OLDCO|nr:OLC1v1015587C3 [Oldenlandia corymbosa var. corymbosa]
MAFFTRRDNSFRLIITIFIICLHCENHLASSAGSSTGFVQTRGTRFILNGSPFLFNGFNSYWMMRVATQPSQRYKVSNVYREATAAGLTVCRTWAFSDGGDQALQMSPGVYDERVFQALDFVISEARKYGVRLILSLSNNYKDYGGRPQYVKWARDAGVHVNSDDDFYTNNVVKTYYKNHIKKVLTRINTITRIAYKDDPTIMAWELINEPRCQQDLSGKTLTIWVKEMASYVKSLDNKHLVEIGMEGFYGDSMPNKKQYNPGYQVGTDFISNNQIKEVDFTTIHAYPDIWLSKKNDNEQMIFMRRWITSHGTDSSTILKKPLILTEFGKSSKDPGYQLSARDTYMNAVYHNIYTSARSGGLAGGLVWQILAERMEPFDDGYEIVLSQDPSTTRIIAQQSRQMASLEHTMSK